MVKSGKIGVWYLFKYKICEFSYEWIGKFDIIFFLLGHELL